MMSIISDIVLLAILVASALLGLKRGLVCSVMHFATVIIAIALAFIFTPKISPYFYDIIEPAIRNAIGDGIEKISEESKENFDISEIENNLSKKIGNISDIIGEYDIDSIFSDISEEDMAKIEEYISKKNKTADSSENIPETAIEAYDTAIVADEAKAVFDRYKEKIASNISEPIASKLSEAAAFVSIFAASAIVLSVLTILVDLIFKLGFLNGINKTGGLIFGIIIGLFWVYIVSIAFSIAVPLIFGNTEASEGVNIAKSYIINAVTKINAFFSDLIKNKSL